MIVCHCNRIDHTAIEATAEALVTADPYRLLTPVGIYKAMGKRPRCGGCLTLAANIIHGRCPNNGDCRTCPLAGMCENEGEIAVITRVDSGESLLGDAGDRRDV